MINDLRNAPMFNPDARVERVALANGQCCYVIDDALRDPQGVVDWAVSRRDGFRAVDFNAYPGTYRMTTPAIEDALRDYFVRHMRPRFDARRLLQMHCRLSMVTLAPQALKPYQWLCHSDTLGLEATQSIQASVLYLFKQAHFGGTSFYEPARPAGETRQLFADALALSSETFSRRYCIEPSYIHDSNAWFTHVGRVPARWNRMIFYDGSLLHSGDILRPAMLTDDPATGRLTFNGFFVCRRNAE